MTAPNPSLVDANRLTASLLTPLGRGAIATIRVVGNLDQPTERPSAEPQFPTVEETPRQLDSLFQAANGKRLSQQPLQAISFGRWGWSDTEELVVCRPAPDVLEIYCHGGDAAVQRVLNDLTTAGCRVIDWKSQIAECRDALEAECQEVLSRTTTWRTTQIALEQSSGLLREAFLRLKGFIAEGNESEFRRLLDDLLRWSTFGLRLTTPWSIVLTGRPNVGKSSLINALLGYERAIVFDQPGTTRDVVTGETAFDGWPVVLADTAGLRDNAPELEAAGIALARNRLQTADLRLILLDISQPPSIEDAQLLKEWGEQSNSLIIAHKTDQPDLWGARVPANALRVSSVTGDGIAELQKSLVNRIVPQVPQPGTPIPLTERQIALLAKFQRSSINEDMIFAIDQLIRGE